MSSSDNKRNSRANSTSSSVTTVKHAASRSSRRNSYLKSNPTSPEDGMNSFDLLDPRSAARGRLESLGDKSSSPNLNINRWSHSTSSSMSGIDTEASKKQSRSSGRRSSIGAGFSGNGYKPSATEQRPRTKSQPRSSSRSPKRPTQYNTTLPAEFGATSLRERSPHTSAGAMTPTSVYNSNSSVNNGEVYGEQRQSHKQNIKLGEPITAMSIHYITAGGQKPKKIEDVSTRISEITEKSRGAMSQYEQPPPIGNETTVNGQRSSQSSEQRRSRGHRSPTQKTMLSRALAKANTAVLLDNDSNIEGAIEAYAEACDLLEQVMLRSSDTDDRKKLSAIRRTYSDRIAELHDLDDSFVTLMEKSLPDEPLPNDPNTNFFNSMETTDDFASTKSDQVHIPPRQESLLPTIYGNDSFNETPANTARRLASKPTNLSVPMDSQFMPQPLSPRKPIESESVATSSALTHSIPNTSATLQHTRDNSAGTTSWLDTVDDTESATSSSRLSSIDLGTGNSMNLVEEIEAEFDAAMNAAAGSTYGNDLGPDITPKPEEKYRRPSVGQIRRSSIQNKLQSLQDAPESEDIFKDYLDEDTTEEEERLLDEMTQGYIFDDFNFDDNSKSALPRQSDSSSFSHRTWGSSIPSTTISTGTTLSTLTESFEGSSVPKTLISANDPSIPSSVATEPLQTPETARPNNPPARPPSFERSSTGLGLRDRRLSGQSAGQLKIETYTRGSTSAQPPTRNASLPKIDIPPNELQDVSHITPMPVLTGPPSTSTLATLPMTPMTSVNSNDSTTSDSPATPALTHGVVQGVAEETQVPPSPRLAKPIPPQPIMRKNLSSSSLKMRNLSTGQVEDSPITPGSAGFPPDNRKGAPPLPNSYDSKYNAHNLQTGGMYLFDDTTGNSALPNTPKTPSAFSGQGLPLPLEPCPDSFLLRPFWLMRCLYEVLTHPKGGYISTKLFIPRDIWRVRNVKLKMLEEKLSHCDLLSAALMKLSKVDHLDADAVLEELTIFEGVLDQVRASMSKKLGSDVGVSSSAQVFKSPSEETNDPLSSKPGNSAAKSFASGWRKLRSKSSTAVIPHTQTGNSNKETPTTHPTGGLTMSSLPMTRTANPILSTRNHNNRARTAPTSGQMSSIPPLHAQYMASLARLFDVAQILDSIARQVEDPGLKFSSKTHVGLELSLRNVAEFLGFYVLRFVMADLTTLVDKYLKRSTEWVLT